MALKIHVDEFEPLGGARLAAELGACGDRLDLGHLGWWRGGQYWQQVDPGGETDQSGQQV